MAAPEEPHLIDVFAGVEAYKFELDGVRGRYGIRNTSREEFLYREYHVRDRNRERNDGLDLDIDGIRVLPPNIKHPQNPDQSGATFEITLKGGENSVPFKYVKHNQYLVAFMSGNIWYEFKPQQGMSRVIPDSRDLPCKCSYCDRKGPLAKPLRRVFVTPEYLESILKSLRNYHNKPDPRIAEYMDVIALVTSESIRFREVMEFFAAQMDENNIQRASFRIEKAFKVRNWKYLSQVLMWGREEHLDDIKEARDQVLLALHTRDIN